MYKGYKISVAMATYNGGLYIYEQLMSIIQQTKKVDEIVISDDGSADNTLNIINSIARENKETSIIVLHNKNNHGPRGNFENAIQNCSGDLIFLSDQDDIWYPEKVEKVIEVFSCNCDANLVCHNAVLVDKNGDQIEGTFNSRLMIDTSNSEKRVYKLERNKYLERAVSAPLINGMVLCMSNKLKAMILPFPKTYSSHDWWIMFVGVNNNTCYYLDEVLTKYRLHGKNTAGNKAYTGNIIDKVSKGKKHVEFLKRNSIQTVEMYNMSLSMEPLVDVNRDKDAYETVKKISDISKSLLDIEASNRFVACGKLLLLYKNNIRYRKSGRNAFLLELAYVLLNSKRKRIDTICRMKSK